MKKSQRLPLKLLIMISVVPAALSSAMNPTFTEHTPRDGDKLHQEAFRPSALIISVNDSTQEIILDSGSAIPSAICDVTTYVDGDTISYIQSATKHRFLLRGDTLLYLGYENRATDFHLDRPLRMALFPLTDGQEVIDSWKGYIHHHGSRLLKRMAGLSVSRVQNGHSIVDDTDTLSNLTKLSWTLDMSYADPDSVSLNDPDSVASDKISEMKIDVRTMMSERLLTDRKIWFSEDVRYPVLTETEVFRIRQNPDGEATDTVAFSGLACYYPAENQYYDTVEEIVRKSSSGAPRSGTYLSRYEDYENSVGNLITVGEPELNDLAVCIRLSSEVGSVEATVTLYSDSGMILSEPVRVTLDQASRNFKFPLPAGWKGVILLVADAGKVSYTKKIII